VYDKVTGLPPHPRGCGTFPRVLQTMVREKRIITLSEALNKMTSMPAERFGLKSKGRIIAGADADITIFNPATVLDAATYADPAVDPQGIAYVIVGGTPVVDGGQLQRARPGKAVRLQA
jgi:N-acyl-D-aspartate/D-glutamate deacylase